MREVLIANSVTLDGSPSFDPNPNGSITNYAWNLNCLNQQCTDPATGSQFTGGYGQPFNFFPSLTITNSLNGVTTSSPREILVVNQGHAPKAVIKVNNNVILFTDVITTLNSVLTFDSSNSFDYDGTISNRLWDFGDGTQNTNNQTSVQKVFPTAGVYFVMLQVTDNDLNNHRLWQKVIVNPTKILSKKLNFTPKDFDGQPADDNEQNLSNACGSGSGQSCFELAKIYESRGDVFVADQLKMRACTLGYQLACVK